MMVVRTEKLLMPTDDLSMADVDSCSPDYRLVNVGVELHMGGRNAVVEPERMAKLVRPTVYIRTVAPAQ